MCFGFFDPCGGGLLTVVDGVSCAGRDAAAGSGFLGVGFAEGVVCAGFVADGDGVAVCVGGCDGVAVCVGGCDGGAACGGFCGCGSGEHVGERLCCLVVCVGVGGVDVGVHGACPLACVVGCFVLVPSVSARSALVSTRVGVVGVSVASRFGHMLLLGRGVACFLIRLRTVAWLFTLSVAVDRSMRASRVFSLPECTRAPPAACWAARGGFG